MRIRPVPSAIAVAGLLFAAPGPACRDGASGTPAGFTPGRGPVAHLTLNGRTGGTFGCTGGLYFTASLENPGPRVLEAAELNVHLESQSPECASHDVPVTSGAPWRIEPRSTAELRQFDWSSGVCARPFGRAGCGWRAQLSLRTPDGPLADSLFFETFPTTAYSCGSDAPRLLEPLEGVRLTGVVDVRATVGREDYCALSLRTLVRAYPLTGGAEVLAASLDLGERARWDTRGLPNGPYVLTAQKTCGSVACGGTSPPLSVQIAN